jgi:hypothetical protein
VPSEVRLLNVLIASPGDAGEARDAVEEALHNWNDHRGDAERIILRPRRWETGSVPISGRGDAQTVINAQLVDEADIVIAIFFHRLGSATPRAASGTAEEIQRAISAGKRVHLYFSNAAVPYDLDLDQFKSFREFRDQMESEGLVAAFDSVSDLVGDVRNAIESDLRSLGISDTPAAQPPVAEISRERSDIYLTLYKWTVEVNSFAAESSMLNILETHFPEESAGAGGAHLNPFDNPPFLSEDHRVRVWVYASPQVSEWFDKIESLEHEINHQAKKNPGVVIDIKELLAGTARLQQQIKKEMAGR